jgi:hypothetical protein
LQCYVTSESEEGRWKEERDEASVNKEQVGPESESEMKRSIREEKEKHNETEGRKAERQQKVINKIKAR